MLKQILKLATMRCGKNWLTKRLRQPVNVIVIVVRFFMESCNELGLAAMVTIKMAEGDRWEHLADSIDLVFAYVALALLIMTPFVLYYYGRRLLYRRLGMTEQEADAITSLFDQYREDDIVGIRFTVIFFLRRFIMIAILTSLPTMKLAQIGSQLYLSMMITIFTVHYLPYDYPIQNKQESVNEITVLFGSYHLFMFTNWISDEEKRYMLGWSIIGFIGLNICFNIFLALYVGMQGICRKFKLKALKASHKRKMHKYNKRESIRTGH